MQKSSYLAFRSLQWITGATRAFYSKGGKWHLECFPLQITKARSSCILTKVFTLWAQSFLGKIITPSFGEARCKSFLLRNLFNAMKDGAYQKMEKVQKYSR